MAFGIENEVDAEVVQDVPPVTKHVGTHPTVTDISQAYQSQGLTQPAADQLALSEQRARAFALFVEVPVLAVIALHPKVPGMLRLGAGLIAAWSAYQIASQEKQIEAMLPEGWG